MKKVLTFVLAVMPLPLSFVYLVACVFMAIADENGWFAGIMEDVYILLLLGFTLVLVAITIAAMTYFIVKACKNPKLTGGMKAIWCVLLYQLNVFVFPVYWFLYLRKD